MTTTVRREHIAQHPTCSDLTEANREISRLRLAYRLLDDRYMDLLAAARAALAAMALGEAYPLFWIQDELASRDQLPPSGVKPAAVAAHSWIGGSVA